ncbi:MAG: SRPBCC family protein [Acidimicrobiia bacterium]|nr:SRPBCC family protein [Acidimicrobiia bacterium]
MTTSATNAAMDNIQFRNFLGAPDHELRARKAATKLRNTLRLNTGLSIATGVAGLAAAGPVADLLGVEQIWLIRLLGAGLLAFAAGVLLVAGSPTRTLQTWSAEISIADLSWVIGTGAIIAMGWLSTNGAVAMAAIAAMVLSLGIAQLRARRGLMTAIAETDAALDESPPIEIHTFQRETDGTPARLWPIISDHALYAKLALNLKAAENITPNGPGFERSCTDGIGRTWSETCTLWDPGHRFDVDINIDDYPYPLQMVQGSWRVNQATGDTSAVGMMFAFQPNRGIAGRLFTPIMHLMFPPILKRIAKGWERAADSV